MLMDHEIVEASPNPHRVAKMVEGRVVVGEDGEKKMEQGGSKSANQSQEADLIRKTQLEAELTS